VTNVLAHPIRANTVTTKQQRAANLVIVYDERCLIVHYRSGKLLYQGVEDKERGRE
jgi:hypothetical protein